MTMSTFAIGSRYRTEQSESWVREWVRTAAGTASPRLSSQFVETRLGATHVLQSPERSGAHDIVCFPGWGLPAAFWALGPGLAELSAAGRVHIVDLPGQPGLSTGVPLSYSGEGIRGWSEDLFDGLGLARAHVIGVSVGGLVALRIAHEHAARVDRIVACAPAGFVLPVLGLGPLYALTTYLASPTRLRCARFYRTCVLGPTQHLPPDVQAEVDEVFFRLASGFLNTSRPPLRLADRELSELEHETLILLGENDPVFSPSGTLRRAQRLLPRLSGAGVLPGHGHALELSRDVMRAARQFLSVRSDRKADAR